MIAYLESYYSGVLRAIVKLVFLEGVKRLDLALFSKSQRRMALPLCGDWTYVAAASRNFAGLSVVLSAGRAVSADV